MLDDAAVKEDLDSFRRRLGEMVEKGAAASATVNDSLQGSLLEGETGSYGLALDYLEEIAQNRPSIAGIREAYYNLLVAYNRMHGASCALERIIKEMQALFDLAEEEVGEGG